MKNNYSDVADHAKQSLLSLIDIIEPSSDNTHPYRRLYKVEGRHEAIEIHRSDLDDAQMRRLENLKKDGYILEFCENEGRLQVYYLPEAIEELKNQLNNIAKPKTKIVRIGDNVIEYSEGKNTKSHSLLRLNGNRGKVVKRVKLLLFELLVGPKSISDLKRKLIRHPSKAVHELRGLLSDIGRCELVVFDETNKSYRLESVRLSNNLVN
jgi:hypothetical protein